VGKDSNTVRDSRDKGDTDRAGMARDSTDKGNLGKDSTARGGTGRGNTVARALSFVAGAATMASFRKEAEIEGTGDLGNFRDRARSRTGVS
jgi:hypothetical protein